MIKSLLKSATDPKLSVPNSSLNIQICDTINASHLCHDEVCHYITKYLMKPERTGLTLSVLEYSLMNTNHNFHYAIALSEIPLKLVELAQSAAPSNRTHILRLCQTYPALASAAYELVAKGAMAESSITFASSGSSNVAQEKPLSISELIDQLKNHIQFTKEIITAIVTGDESSMDLLSNLQNDITTTQKQLSNRVENSFEELSSLNKVEEVLNLLDSASSVLKDISHASKRDLSVLVNYKSENQELLVDLDDLGIEPEASENKFLSPSLKQEASTYSSPKTTSVKSPKEIKPKEVIDTDLLNEFSSDADLFKIAPPSTSSTRSRRKTVSPLEKDSKDSDDLLGLLEAKSGGEISEDDDIESQLKKVRDSYVVKGDDDFLDMF
ncbi:hypothetical protein GEMRC1_003236 [Eukaryota sp. GEM-RC1]